MGIERFVLSSGVGAVIGYITNWLAIKMLFRPHNEVKIMGIKVPFTPGLVPKEKTRIAENIGNSIGTHLLTEETMMESLCSDEMLSQLKKWIESKVDEAKKSDKPIGKLVEELTDENYDLVNFKIKGKVDGFIIKGIRNDEFKDEIFQLLELKIKEFLSISPFKVIDSNTYKNIRSKISYELMTYKNSDNLNTVMVDKIKNKYLEIQTDNKKINEISPEIIQKTIKTYIDSNKDNICQKICEILKEERVEEKLKAVIEDLLKKKLSPMVAMFIKPDLVYDMIVSGVEDHLSEEENKEGIIDVIHQYIDEIFNKDMNSILSIIDENNLDKLLQDVCKFISGKIISDDLIESMLEKMENEISKYNTIEELLNKLNIDSHKLIVDYLREKISVFIEGDGSSKLVNSVVDNITDKIMKMKLKDIFSTGNENINGNIAQFVVEMYKKFIDKKAPEAIELLNIPKIVEEKINEFDTQEMEDIIVGVAEKELKAITWLGALLGCIMGVVSQLLAGMFM